MQLTGLALIVYNSLQLEFIHSTNARYKVQTMLTLANSPVELIVRAFTLFCNWLGYKIKSKYKIWSIIDDDDDDISSLCVQYGKCSKIANTSDLAKSL